MKKEVANAFILIILLSASGASYAQGNSQKECEALLGFWNGTWRYGNTGEMWLNIFSVDDKCEAKYTYRKDSKKMPPEIYNQDRIRPPKMTISCGSCDCSFELKNGKLEATYSDNSGRSDSATFTR